MTVLFFIRVVLYLKKIIIQLVTFPIGFVQKNSNLVSTKWNSNLKIDVKFIHLWKNVIEELFIDRSRSFLVRPNYQKIAIWGTFYVQLLHPYSYIQVFVFFVLEQINLNCKDWDMAIKKTTLGFWMAQTQNYIFVINKLIICSLFLQ